MSKNLTKAGVSYNDLVGSIAVDFEGGFDNFESFVKDLGIDVKKFHPVGLNIYGDLEAVNIGVLCVEAKNLPFKEGAQIVTTEITVTKSLSGFLEYLKRIHIVIHSKHRKTEEYFVEKNVRLEDLDTE